MEPVAENRNNHILDRALRMTYTVNWEFVAYVLIFVLSIITRFAGLGARVMSHDESLHTKFSWDLYNSGNFQHTPLMHGPLLFEMTAFFYLLFGDNDFTARIYPALIGVLVVMMPALFRRWLGRTGALLTAVMFLASPMLMYYSRYIRHDLPAIFFAMLMLYAIFQYLDGSERFKGKNYWLILLAVGMSLLLASKEVGFIYIAIFGSFLTLFWVFTLIQRYVGLKQVRSVFYLVSGGMILGTVAALLMIVLFSFIPPTDLDADSILNAEDNCVNISNVFQADDDGDGTGNECQMVSGTPLGGYLITGSITIMAVLGLVLVVSALWVFRSKAGYFPWREVLIIILVATLFCGFLLVAEEVSRTEPETAAPVDPAEAEGVTADSVSALPYILAWFFGIVVVLVAIAGFVFGFWKELRREPIFDVLIMMGTLILPWLAAGVVFASGASPTDYTSQGIMRSAFALIPFAAVAVGVGLAWNWRAWLPAMAAFMAIYVFTFTTLFTNGSGLASGMVGSLGYWLEQQDVRRGNQPQYYYMVIMTPIYEFLPLLGGILAGVYGAILLWRHRVAWYLGLEAEPEPPQDDDAPEAVAMAEMDATLSSLENRTDEILLPTPEMIEADKAQYDEQPRKNKIDLIPEAERLLRVPFMLFVGYWAVLNFYAYTLSGEKMPWLTTHLTVPLILLTGWFGGRMIAGIRQRGFAKHGWKLLLLFPMFSIALFRVIKPLLTGQGPFQGTSQIYLGRTMAWMAAITVVLVISYGLAWIINRIGWGQFWRIVTVSVGILLIILTFRAAFVASFINYDMATEFLVYAHAGPGHTIIFDWMEEISERTTGDMDLVVAYDFKMSWPGSWYFREYPNAIYFDRNPSVQVLDDAIAVVVGSETRGQVEPLLGDRYYHYEYIRMWWPMQDYFNLTWARVAGAFNFSDPNSALLREGLWDIWWSRDYTTYGQATGGNFELTAWPVSDRMHFYVRKDVAAQVWDLGVGAEVISEYETSLADLWTPRPANLVWGQEGMLDGDLNRPRGVAAAEDGTIYVADSMNHRIQVFDNDGAFLRSWGLFEVGEFGTALGGNFNQPWGIDVGTDGNIYVADTWNHRVQVFSPEGEFIRTWGMLGQLSEAGLTDQFWGPRDVAVDVDGNVYVADTGNKRVRVYDNMGVWLRDIGSGGAGAGQLNEPVGLAVHSDGRLFIADTWNRRIQVFNTQGQYLTSWVVNGWYGDQGNRPYLAIDEVRGHVYATDPDAARVLVYDLNGTPLGSFGQPGQAEVPLGATQFNIVAGVAIDAQGNVFISDSGAARMLRFDPWDELVVAPLGVDTGVIGESDAVEEPVNELPDEPVGESDPLDEPAVATPAG